jgi:hypothetical protein
MLKCKVNLHLPDVAGVTTFDPHRALTKTDCCSFGSHPQVQESF